MGSRPLRLSNLRQVSVIVLAVDKDRVVVVAHEGQRCSGIWAMPHRRAKPIPVTNAKSMAHIPGFIQVLLTADDSPLVGDVVAQHGRVGKVGLK